MITQADGFICLYFPDWNDISSPPPGGGGTELTELTHVTGGPSVFCLHNITVINNDTVWSLSIRDILLGNSSLFGN